MSAADSHGSPSGVGQTGEGGSIIYFLLLPHGNIMDLLLRESSKQEASLVQLFSCPPANSWGIWEMKADMPSPT